MKVAVAVLPNGMINAHFGSAKKVALVTIEDKQITVWDEKDVPFAETHGEGDHHHHDNEHHDHHHHHSHGPNHLNGIRAFLEENQVELVLLDHEGPSMRKIRNHLDVKVVVGANGNAKEAVQSLIDQGFTE